MSNAATIEVGTACRATGGKATGASASFPWIGLVGGNFANVNGAQLGAGFTLLDAFAVFQNDYSLDPGGNAIATFTRTNINASLASPAGYPDTVAGGLNSSPIYLPALRFRHVQQRRERRLRERYERVPQRVDHVPRGQGFGRGKQPATEGGIGVAAYVFYDYSTRATGTPEPPAPGSLRAALAGFSAIAGRRIRG